MHRLIIIGLLLAALSRTNTHPANPLDAVLAAYEAGQFRILYTRGEDVSVSPSGTHIYAYRDGLYRVSDGAFYEGFDEYGRAIFSSDGQYVAKEGLGVYRLADMELVIASEFTVVEDYPMAEPEHLVGVVVGRIEFSHSGAYVSISGDGVYRLSDLRKIIDTSQQEIYYSESLEVDFSDDDTMVSTSAGVYRLSDGQLLLPTQTYRARFSPNNAYVDTQDGVYRLSDGQKLFDATHRAVFFTPDTHYALVNGAGMYRLSDGQWLYDFPALEPLASPRFSSDSEYMAVAFGIYRVENGEKLFDLDKDRYQTAFFSPDGLSIAIDRNGIYRLRDKQQVFELNTDISFWDRFSPNGAYFALASGGIYRLADRQRVLGYSYSTFSPNSEYVAFNGRGVYRLSDQEKLSEIIPASVSGFSADSEYLFAESDGIDWIYRVRDGRRYTGLRVLDATKGILAVGNTVLIIDPTQQAQQQAFIHLADEEMVIYRRHTNGEIGYIGKTGAKGTFAILSESDGWYEIIYPVDEAAWVPASAGIRFVLPDNGVQ